MANRKRNKKGSALDLLFIIGAITVFAIVLLIGFTVTSKFNDNIQSNSVMDSKAKAASQTLTDYYPGILDYSGVFILTVLCVITLILAALVRIHPIFIPIFIIGLTIIVFLAGIYSNVYTEMASSPQLAPYADQLNIMSFIMTWLPKIIAVVGVIMMILLYKRTDYIG